MWNAARGDEEHMVGANGAVLGGHGAAFDNGQDVALNAFARDIGTVAARTAPGDLVDFVEEHDPRVLRPLDGARHHLVHVDQVLQRFLFE